MLNRHAERQCKTRSIIKRVSIKMCYSLDTSGAAARRQRLRHVFPKTLTRIRADQHGAERGFALTRLAKSSLIRHAVAVAFSCGYPWCFCIAKFHLPFCSFVSRRRCAIVPQSYFHYQNCVEITFRYCFKFVQITHNSVLVCLFVYVYDVYCSQHVKV